MQIHVATPTTPPRPDASTVGFELGARLENIEVTDGRRLFEGWASLVGVDWQDEDVPTSIFEAAIQDYMAKNPIVLWDHKRDHPIGRVLHAHVDEKGLFIQGEVLQTHHYGDDDDGPLAAKANEVWALMQGGIVKGLSWAGRARKRYVWSEELQRHIKQPVELLLHEITITPIQVHPGAKITGVNTLAKALEIAKALPLGTSTATTPEGEIEMSLDKLRELHGELVATLHSLPNETDIPADLLIAHEQISKALGLSTGDPKPVDPVVEEEADLPEAMVKAIDNLNEQIVALGGKPAPLRNRVTHGKPKGSAPKPGEQLSDEEICSKALSIGATSIQGVSNYGEGIRHGATALDTLKVWMLANRHVISCSAKGLGVPPEITPTPGMVSLARAALG